jgi:hypothetical protein
MRVDTEDLAKGLFDELAALLSKYNGSLLTPTVIGVLDMVKADLIYATAFDLNHPNNEDDEDED